MVAKIKDKLSDFFSRFKKNEKSEKKKKRKKKNKPRKRKLIFPASFKILKVVSFSQGIVSLIDGFLFFISIISMMDYSMNSSDFVTVFCRAMIELILFTNAAMSFYLYKSISDPYRMENNMLRIIFAFISIIWNVLIVIIGDMMPEIGFSNALLLVVFLILSGLTVICAVTTMLLCTYNFINKIVPYYPKEEKKKKNEISIDDIV